MWSRASASDANMMPAAVLLVQCELDSSSWTVQNYDYDTIESDFRYHCDVFYENMSILRIDCPIDERQELQLL